MTFDLTTNAVDFGRSFVRFSSDRVNHTPRMRLDALCTFLPASGAARTYYLSCPCLAETMYTKDGMVQTPVADFNIVVKPADQFMTIRRHANSKIDRRFAGKIGEVMPTFDGKGAVMLEVDCRVKHYARLFPLTTYAEFRRALLDDLAINCRTTYTDADGSTKVVLDYPATTTNVAHDKEAWQVDAGPVLVPVNDKAAKLEVDRFEPAFCVFNRWDYAELAVRALAPLEAEKADGPKHHFYHTVKKLNCKHQMWWAE